MPELSAIQTEVRTLTINLGALPVVVGYYPAAFTRKMQRESALKAKEVAAKIAAGEEPGEDDTEEIAAMLIKALHSWDITVKGKPLPITVSSLVDSLGYILASQLYEGILNSINPNFKTA